MNDRAQMAEEIAALLEAEASAFDSEYRDYPAAGVFHEAAALVREWGATPKDQRPANE